MPPTKLHPKVKVATVSGSITTLAAFGLTHLSGVGLPSWLASILTVAATLVGGYLAPAG